MPDDVSQADNQGFFTAQLGAHGSEAKFERAILVLLILNFSPRQAELRAELF